MEEERPTLHPWGLAMNQLFYCSSARGQREGSVRTCPDRVTTVAFIAKESKFNLPFYAKDCLNPEGHVWPPVPAQYACVLSPSPSHGSAQPAGRSHSFPLLQQQHSMCLWFLDGEAAWSHRPALPPWGPFVDWVKKAAVFECGVSRIRSTLPCLA